MRPSIRNPAADRQAKMNRRLENQEQGLTPPGIREAINFAAEHEKLNSLIYPHRKFILDISRKGDYFIPTTKQRGLLFVIVKKLKAAQ